ncbi:MAG: hypothetical protein A3J97_05255 [Spirochaetes bacterium RIFOXYC1_FULL_54_7]|nr:MAG: hypothetical protein A3J97_05255 [Spirochaetes bacterium RIFOXYC1_FULL_54_7]
MGIDFTSFTASLPRTDGIINLSPGEARDLLDHGALLVDLREAYETNFRVFDVDEVLYLPWTVFATRMRVLPRDHALILADAAGIYCREAAALLVSAGYTNLAKLSGGMIDWDAAGCPVLKDVEYELGGQCACKIKSHHGGNPLMDKHQDLT